MLATYWHGYIIFTTESIGEFGSFPQDLLIDCVAEIRHYLRHYVYLHHQHLKTWRVELSGTRGAKNFKIILHLLSENDTQQVFPFNITK